jgi:hypothetical protein
MTTPKPMTFAVAGIAAVALAFGAYAVGNSSSGSAGSNAAAAAPFARGGQPPANGQAPPGFGTPATGAAADKAKAAALAKYKGSAERVMKLSDGSYVVHVLTSGGGEYHVAVSKDFKVTGARQGGPGGAPPSGSMPGSPPSSA